MSDNDYENLGNEMKAMKNRRAGLMVEIKGNHRRIRTQTGKTLAAAERFVAETGKANEKMAAQTRQMLAQAQRELKVGAGRIITDACEFLAQTSSDNAKLRDRTNKMLGHAHAETKAQARRVMAQTRATVAGLKTETGQVLADAAGVMQRLCTSSRQRAAGWRNVLRTVHGNGHGAPARASAATAVMERPARTKANGKKKASAKNN
jgi:hypothetical protein